MMSKLGRWSMVVGACLLVGSGCTEYFEVDEACHPEGRVPGAGALNNAEEDALDAMNCYRRLLSLGRASVDGSVQEAMTDHGSYIRQNPDALRLLGPGGPAAFLTQSPDDVGFTGVSIFERLELAGYTIFDPSNTRVSEFLLLATNDFPGLSSGGVMFSGAQAMDALLREADWRENALQRSWIAGGYVEIPLDPGWWAQSGVCEVEPAICGGGTTVPAGFSGTLYYLTVLHTDPPTQRSFRPFSYPKFDQTEVPLFSWFLDENNVDVLTGGPQLVQLSYPISIFGNAADPMSANLGTQNVYGLQIEAGVTDNRGIVHSPVVVLPGADPQDGFPDGYNLRRSAAIYLPEPFAPGVTYRVVARVRTSEAEYESRFEFTAAAQDAGLGAAPAARAVPSVWSGGVVREIDEVVAATRGQLPGAVTQP